MELARRISRHIAPGKIVDEVLLAKTATEKADEAWEAGMAGAKS
jgi:hypothetical protein